MFFTVFRVLKPLVIIFAVVYTHLVNIHVGYSSYVSTKTFLNHSWVSPVTLKSNLDYANKIILHLNHLLLSYIVVS